MDRLGAQHIPSNSATRWTYNSRLVNVIADNIDLYLEAFEEIIEDDEFDTDSTREAVGFQNCLNNLDFIFCLFTYNFTEKKS